MKEINERIKTTISKLDLEFDLVGFLNGNIKINKLSDIDLFFLSNTKKPSDYFNVCKVVCENLVNEIPNIITFSSFKQQTLLRELSKGNLIPVHFLHYLSTSHLVIREVNTLPRYIHECIDIIDTTPSIFESIKYSYNNREKLLNPETIRIFYYFDILNEITPIVFNGLDERLPSRIIQTEILHKLKFISSHLGFELLSYKYSIPQDEITLDSMEQLMKENNLEFLVSQKEDIFSILSNEQKLNMEDILTMLKSTYLLFDQVKTLTKFL